ncbi:MAG: cyclic pyranopterin monophosphate synthase MoaC [Coprothermobacterota bacterium]|nr:cyclic pyranopterin monophosphate synthase MoaC [Coprothermobacterota bacterium]
MVPKKLTHLDHEGRARMVDVGAKPVTQREAIARARVLLSLETFTLVKKGSIKKGDVLSVAQIAGIQAAKRAWEWIPLAHPLPLTFVDVQLWLDPSVSSVEIEAICRTEGKTGAEMEALTAVATAALTVYDMCKAAERGICITDLRLIKKSGGKSGTWEAGA